MPRVKKLKEPAPEKEAAPKKRKVTLSGKELLQKLQAIGEIYPEDCKELGVPWPPPYGIWAAYRTDAMRRLKLDPQKPLIVNACPKPGVVINSIGIIGYQVLPVDTWAQIRRTFESRAESEKEFVTGGREPTKLVGEFKG